MNVCMKKTMKLARSSCLRLLPISSRRSYADYSAGAETQTMYPGHIPISPLQRTILAVGSTLLALNNPARGDMVAVSGEASGEYALHSMLRKMSADPEGSLILKERPRINSTTVDLKKLSSYPEGTLGRVYTNFLRDNGVSPDSRLPVRFVDDPDLAYVMQRYREVHDLIHAVLGMPTNMLGEVTVKWVEGIQTGLPMCIGGGIFGPIRLKIKNRTSYLTTMLPWAIRNGTQSRFLLNVYYERRWEQDIDQLRRELNLEAPPAVAPKRKAK